MSATAINPYRSAGARPAPAGSRAPSFHREASAQPAARPTTQGKNPLGKVTNPRTAASAAVTDPDNGSYNPGRFAGYRSDVRQAMSGRHASNDRMFDGNGQLNAYDNRDALTQIAHLLQNVSKSANMHTFRREAALESSEERTARMQVLAAAMNDPTGEGFAIVGQELLLPIKDIIDYEGWIRKIFRVRPLAQGELFRIAKDVRATAWIVGQDGQGVESRLYGKYIQPSEFKITSFPTVDIEDIYQMNYDVLDRAQDTARQEIEVNEDKRGLALLSRAADTVNSTTIFGTLGVAAFEDIRFQVERHRLIVEKFLINRQELSDIVKNMSTAVDPVTERELILAGYIGNILNAQILTAAGTGVEEVIPAGEVYAVTGANYLGEMGVRIELFSEPFNMYAQKRLVKGWAFGEMCGFGLPNSRSVAKGTK